MPKFEPNINPDTGGTSLGNSYLSAWARCPRKWYNEYYRKTDVGRGIGPLATSIDLLTGSLFHEGLAAWYQSGFRDGEDTGEYQLDAAMAKLVEFALTVQAEFSTVEQYTETVRLVGGMLQTYDQTYGYFGNNTDFPEIRIAADHNGEPLIERDFRFELKPGYWYTGRIDAICLHKGLLKVLEHKTAKIRSASGRLRTLGTDSQFAGEQWLLQEALPEIAVSGVLVNVVLKDWGGPLTKSGKPSTFREIAVRETTIRTSAQIEQWRHDAVSIIDEIDDAVWTFEHQINRGTPLEHAEAKCFPVRGTRNGQCHAYNRECEFIDLCHAPGMHERLLPQFNKKKDHTDE